MISTRHLGIVVLACGLAGVPGSAAAAPTRDPGLLQQIRPHVSFAYDEDVTDGVVEDFTVPIRPVPEGSAAGRLIPISPASETSGCDPNEFTGLPAGSLVLVRRGTCTFAQKVINAQAAGAAGVLIFNDVPGLINITFEGAAITVPVLFITRDLGESFAAGGSGRVQMRVQRPSAAP